METCDYCGDEIADEDVTETDDGVFCSDSCAESFAEELEEDDANEEVNE